MNVLVVCGSLWGVWLSAIGGCGGYTRPTCSVGTLLADLAMMCVPLFTIFISWRAGDMNNFWANDNGLAGFIMILFTFQASSSSSSSSSSD